jgi:hypothetical protein
MQDIMQRLGMPADGHSPFDHNTAAIALAVAMNKARLELADRDGVKAESKTFAMARLEAMVIAQAEASAPEKAASRRASNARRAADRRRTARSR